MSTVKRIWHFIWKSNSILSWIVNIILAFIIVKFLIYPGIGLLLNTDYPIVAVVSDSMKHDKNFEEWWDYNKNWYVNNNINKEQFSNFPLNNGFNKGDIIVLKGSNNFKMGDVIVFQGNSANPIIHRIVKIDDYLQTKGDNNPTSFEALGESNISRERLEGKALFKIPLLGWFKIIFTDLLF